MHHGGPQHVPRVVEGEGQAGGAGGHGAVEVNGRHAAEAVADVLLGVRRPVAGAPCVDLCIIQNAVQGVWNRVYQDACGTVCMRDFPCG